MHRPLTLLLNKFVTATAILAMLLAAVPVLPVHAASITVNVTTDDYLNDGTCSLREAIISANTNAPFFGCVYTGSGPDDIITLQSGSTYTLTRVGTTTTQGDLDVSLTDGTSGNLTLQASGTTNAIIDASATPFVTDGSNRQGFRCRFRKSWNAPAGGTPSVEATVRCLVVQ